jgi:hypothetical protein
MILWACGFTRSLSIFNAWEARHMPAFFAYSWNNHYLDSFRHPIGAYKLVSGFARTDLSPFIKQESVEVDATKRASLNLGGTYPGGLVMLGTTTELQEGLARDLTPHPIKWIVSTSLGRATTGGAGWLCMKYVRILAPGSTRTKTMISIGPWDTWWGAQQLDDVWKIKGWRDLSTDTFAATSLEDLASIAVPRARAKDTLPFVTPTNFI